jgi:hypothetical protein
VSAAAIMTRAIPAEMSGIAGPAIMVGAAGRNN